MELQKNKIFIELCLPVHNEEKILRKNILKILKFCQDQNYSFGWNIVIINNGSTDSSLKISEELQNEYSQVKYANIQKAGKGRAIK